MKPAPFEYHSPRTQRNRKFIDAARYLESYAPHPKGHLLCVTTRGKLFSFHNWEGPVLQHGEADGVRYRLTEWLNDGKRLVTVSDSGGEEALEVFDRDLRLLELRAVVGERVHHPGGEAGSLRGAGLVGPAARFGQESGR